MRGSELKKKKYCKEEENLRHTTNTNNSIKCEQTKVCVDESIINAYCLTYYPCQCTFF